MFAAEKIQDNDEDRKMVNLHKYAVVYAVVDFLMQ